MNSRLKVALSTSLLTPLFVIAPVLAVEGTGTTTTVETTQTTAQTEQSKQELQARIQKRKDALKIKLTTVEQKRIQARCKNAQGMVHSLQAKTTGAETGRTQAYGNLVDRLNKLQAKLDEKGADTAEFKTEITTLQTKLDAFQTDLGTYKAAVADLADVDCVTDPVGFKAALQDSRTALTKLRDDSTAVRTYLNDTIKPTLKKIRASLSPDKQTTDSTTDTTTGSN